MIAAPTAAPNDATAANGSPGAGESSADASWLPAAQRTLWRRRWLLALGGFIGLVCAIAYLRSADYSYAVTMQVAPSPASARDTGGLSALSGLASLTGINIAGVPATPFRLYLEGIFTREVANKLARDPVILAGAFPDEWDAATRRWHPPGGIVAALHDGLFRLVGAPVRRWTPPGGERLQDFIIARVGVDQNPKTPIVTIGIDAVDRGFARHLLASLHATVDTMLRDKALTRSRQNIAWIDDRLATMTVADHRLALLSTRSDQEQKLMLARNPAAYSAESFGTITASANPTKPRQVPLLLLGLLAGLGLAVLLALLVPPRRAVGA
jgi:uncharacterized protein involved in exopolysaccharide biosynthesis